MSASKYLITPQLQMCLSFFQGQSDGEARIGIRRMSLQNLRTFDPFAEESELGSEGKFVHIRIQQRNGRKTITTVQGLPEKYDKKKILKQCKREFACNGTVVQHDQYGEVIQLQGDQRDQMKKFLCDWKLATPEGVKLHGF